jgi:uncharacterized protein (DUF924 family)
MSDALSKDRLEPAWAAEVLKFWFDEVGEDAWFARADGTDAEIRERFLTLHQQLAGHEDSVAATPGAMLAGVIVLDQFSRHLYRGMPAAFATDPAARRLSARAIGLGYDLGMNAHERLFLYMPFEHSEDKNDQALSVELIARLGNDAWTADAIEHKTIIDRFGRFPHRNAVLDRVSCAEEVVLLSQPKGWY